MVWHKLRGEQVLKYYEGEQGKESTGEAIWEHVLE